ncbi:hypothetical protein C8R44DRAFT_247492 [Mycena epipterygia]|nr:hypothetical protein C8R44DRAFT_247492 [Mycena epipterygia]
MASTTTEELALRIHVLACVHGDKSHLVGHRDDINERTELEGFFTDKKLAAKFVDVAKAMTTICTAAPGEDNFAIMLGYSNTDVHLFYSQNGGAPEDRLCAYLESVWELLQQIHRAACVKPDADPSLETPPRSSPKEEDTLIIKLSNKITLFVAEKALHRAQKRLEGIRLLYRQRISNAGAFEAGLLRAVLGVALAGKAAYVLIPNKNKPKPDPVDTTNPEWQIYLDCVRILHSLTKSAPYARNAETVQSLQNAAQALPSQYKFDFLKCMDKMIQVHRATLTLVNLAVSSRHGWFVTRKLILQGFPIPTKEPISVLPTSIQTNWYPADISFEEVMARMRSNGSSSGDHLLIQSNVHPECQLVVGALRRTWKGSPLGSPSSRT